LLLERAVNGLAVVAFARRRKGVVFPGTAMNYRHRILEFRDSLSWRLAAPIAAG
jgi:hypothetical protein